MKENASALYSKYVIDGLRMEVTPGQMLDAACGQQPVQEEFEPIVDERMDPDPTPVVYDSFRMGEYLEKTAAVLTRKVPADYADSYTRCAIAQALIGMIWREGHFRLDDLHVHMGWKWNEAPVGAMAGFYASVEAACDYLDGLGLQLSGYSYADADAERLAEKITVPTLVINSRADTLTPYFMGENIYNGIVSDKKQIWTVDDSAHTEVWLDHNAEYRQRVSDFIASL